MSQVRTCQHVQPVGTGRARQSRLMSLLFRLWALQRPMRPLACILLQPCWRTSRGEVAVRHCRAPS